MRALLDRLTNPVHLAVAIACTWLVASSPWVGMYHGLADATGFINLSHVVLGWATLPLGLLYLAACTLGGRWRLYFPWLAGNFGDAGRDLAGLLHGRLPGSEGGGLFATIEGLLLLTFLATALSGALWCLHPSADAAIVWRGHHVTAAHGFVALFALHGVAVSLHLLDFVRG